METGEGLELHDNENIYQNTRNIIKAEIKDIYEQ
jgi:hypothetical protein